MTSEYGLQGLRSAVNMLQKVLKDSVETRSKGWKINCKMDKLQNRS